MIILLILISVITLNIFSPSIISHLIKITKGKQNNEYRAIIAEYLSRISRS